MKRIFGPKRDEDGRWRRLHSEELHILYLSPNIIWMIKPELRWGSHVARRKEGLSAFKILTYKLTGKRLLEDLGVDGKTLLEWI